MGLPTAEIQTAFIALYRGDSSLQTLLGSGTNPPGNVFDQTGVPTNTSLLPGYIVVFPITTQYSATTVFTIDGNDTFMQISGFTRAGGFANARALMKQVYTLTHKHSFSLQNTFINFLTLFENEQEVPAKDGITQQIVHRYKLQTMG